MEKWTTAKVSSAGYAIAPVFAVEEREIIPDLFRIPASEKESEIARFEAAVLQVQKSLFALAERHLLFGAYILLAGDPDLHNKVTRKIYHENLSAEAALIQVRDEYIKVFRNMSNEYMRDRTADLKDVMRRILFALKGIDDNPFESLKERSIIVASELVPSDIVRIHPDYAAGYVMEEGGVTSHVSIMAKKQEIPCLVSVGPVLSRVCTGTMAIVDTEKGFFYLDPDEALLQEYREKERLFKGK